MSPMIQLCGSGLGHAGSSTKLGAVVPFGGAGMASTRRSSTLAFCSASRPLVGPWANIGLPGRERAMTAARIAATAADFIMFRGDIGTSLEHKERTTKTNHKGHKGHKECNAGVLGILP